MTTTELSNKTSNNWLNGIVASGERSLGAIYNMTMITVNKYLDNLEAMGYIRVDRTAGLDMVYPENMKSPIEIIRDYYRK